MDVNYAPQTDLEKPLSIKDWLITLLLLSIPIVGLVLMFVWALSENKTAKKTYCQAMIVYLLIMIGLITFLVLATGASILTAISSIS